MYLIIETDIVDAAVGKNEVAIDILRQCASAIKRGKHIVDIKITDVHKILKMPNIFSKIELASFDFVRSKMTQIGYLKSLLRIKCVISFAVKTERVGDIIYINPNITGGFEFMEETHLLVENLEDAFFFKYLTEFYQFKYKTALCKTNSYKLMGGGDTTSKVMKYERDLQQHFVIAIADSDKHFPGDPHIGDTATKIKKCLSSKPFNCDMYHMTHVCEIENLVPFEYIRHIPNFKPHVLVTDSTGFNRSFFDMKDGIHYSYMFSDEGFKHWSTELKHLVSLATFTQIDSERKSLTQTEFESKYKDKYLFEAFGSKILSQAVKQMKEEKAFVTEGDLSPNQLHEWETIGSIITNWCCCFSGIRV